MAGNGLNISLKSYDSIFQNEEQRNSIQVKPIDRSELKPYAQHPFKVQVNEEMYELADSIKQHGILSPIIARPHPEGGYEIVSGHRRVKASELAGIEKVPVLVRELDDDAAIILLVDSNLHRENILPSEKAYAYQMKLEAMKRQGARSDLTSAQIGQKLKNRVSKDILAEQVGESRNQIQRYIRLTNLIDPILEMVDNKEIALNAAVELSYLGSKEQAELLKAMEREEAVPSIAQAKKLREFSQRDKLNTDVIDSIMLEQKPEKVKITLGEDKLRKYFPKNYSKQQIEDTVMKLIENWYRKRQQEMER